MFSVDNLTIIQGGKRLWDSVSFSLTPGERLGISAPSGFGKTTLGRVLAQWQSATSGQILVGALPCLKKAIALSSWCHSIQNKASILTGQPVKVCMMPGGLMRIGLSGW